MKGRDLIYVVIIILITTVAAGTIIVNKKCKENTIVRDPHSCEFAVYLIHPYVCEVMGTTVTIELDHIDVNEGFESFYIQYGGGYAEIKTKYIDNIERQDMPHFPELLLIPLANIKYIEKFQ